MRRVIAKLCACGCETTIYVSSKHPNTKYVKGHQRAWLNKRRPEMIGNTYGFIKGRTAWNKNKKLWGGSSSSYNKLHYWIRKVAGRPIECEQCGSTEQLVWANKSQTYQKVVEDWIPLCRSCHMKYDMVFIREVANA